MAMPCLAAVFDSPIFSPFSEVSMIPYKNQCHEKDIYTVSVTIGIEEK
jgi:hypothetical protein